MASVQKVRLTVFCIIDHDSDEKKKSANAHVGQIHDKNRIGNRKKRYNKIYDVNFNSC